MNSNIKIKLTLLTAGYCTQREYFTWRGGRWQEIIFPATFALLEHPHQGLMLFDTGYAPRLFDETRLFPYNLYAKATPVQLKPHESAQQQLAARGIAASEINYVILSHFHADHVAGVIDFSQATYLYFQAAYEAVCHLSGLRAVLVAFVPKLLPPDFVARSRMLVTADYIDLPNSYKPFDQAIDLWGDGSMFAVMLPGHAAGQMGLFLTTANGQDVFLVADACWHSGAYREYHLPHPLTRLFMSSWHDYQVTLVKLHQFHQLQPHVQIIPTHCTEILPSK